jgi:hypothetical protein
LGCIFLLSKCCFQIGLGLFFLPEQKDSNTITKEKHYCITAVLVNYMTIWIGALCNIFVPKGYFLRYREKKFLLKILNITPMKRQITLAVTLLLIIAGITSCKKERTDTVKKNIVGRWKVAKIETTVLGSATVTYTGVASDYFEFRNNEENEVIINLNSNSYIGKYVVVVGEHLKITYNGKTRDAQVTSSSESKLEFTANVEGATPQTTEKYYLTK